MQRFVRPKRELSKFSSSRECLIESPEEHPARTRASFVAKKVSGRLPDYRNDLNFQEPQIFQKISIFSSKNFKKLQKTQTEAEVRLKSQITRLEEQVKAKDDLVRTVLKQNNLLNTEVEQLKTDLRRAQSDSETWWIHYNAKRPLLNKFWQGKRQK